MEKFKTIAEMKAEEKQLEERKKELKKRIRKAQFDALPLEVRTVLKRFGCDPADEGIVVRRTVGTLTVKK